MNINEIDIPNKIASIMNSGTPSDSEKNEVANWIFESVQKTCKVDGKIDNRCVKKTENDLGNRLKNLPSLG